MNKKDILLRDLLINLKGLNASFESLDYHFENDMSKKKVKQLKESLPDDINYERLKEVLLSWSGEIYKEFKLEFTPGDKVSHQDFGVGILKYAYLSDYPKRALEYFVHFEGYNVYHPFPETNHGLTKIS